MTSTMGHVTKDVKVDYMGQSVKKHALLTVTLVPVTSTLGAVPVHLDIMGTTVTRIVHQTVILRHVRRQQGSVCVIRVTIHLSVNSHVLDPVKAVSVTETRVYVMKSVL